MAESSPQLVIRCYSTANEFGCFSAWTASPKRAESACGIAFTPSSSRSDQGLPRPVARRPNHVTGRATPSPSGKVEPQLPDVG